MPKIIRIRTLFLLFLLMGFFPLLARAGSDFYVVDGDTFVLSGTTYRLWGIDAPELNQICEDQAKTPYPCGRQAKEYLRKIMKGHDFHCTQESRAKSETRAVARCMIDEKDIGQIMVRDGWATDYKYFSKGAYTLEENQARHFRAGLWGGSFQNPRDWRKDHELAH